MAKRGLAAVAPERRREISRLGGKALPNNKRAFSVDRDLARESGKKGGAVRKAQFDAARQARIESANSATLAVAGPELEKMADDVREEHELRLDVPTERLISKPFVPRPRPQTAIIAECADDKDVSQNPTLALNRA